MNSTEMNVNTNTFQTGLGCNQGRINHMAEGASAHGARAFRGPTLYSVLIFLARGWTKKVHQKPSFDFYFIKFSNNC